MKLSKHAETCFLRAYNISYYVTKIILDEKIFYHVLRIFLRLSGKEKYLKFLISKVSLQLKV